MVSLNKKLHLFFLFFSLFILNTSRAQITSSDTLKLTSWNLHLLPSPVFFRSKKKLRTTQIISYFNHQQSNNEVLLFQEVFHKKRRKQLIEGLKLNYPYFTEVVNNSNGKFLKTNSGLIIFSKFPFESSISIKFNDCSSSDCMALKGAQMVSIKYHNKELYILNTHLNSEPPRDIAINQMKHIKDSLIAKAYSQSPFVFIGGDFNINISDTSNYKKMIRIFKTKNKRHYDSTSKKKKSLVTETLDYIFLYNSIESQIEITTFKYLIGPEWEKGKSKKVYGKTVGLSDHYPVKSTIVFQK